MIFGKLSQMRLVALAVVGLVALAIVGGANVAIRLISALMQ